MLSKCETDLIKLSNTISKYCVGMEGNLSGKVGKNILIKASGAKLSSLTKEDLVLFNNNGEQISNIDKKGSMELGFHIFLMEDDAVNYIAHTHPTSVLKILCSNYGKLFSNNRLFPDQVIFNGKKSCYVPYAKPGDELTKKIKKSFFDFFKKEKYFPKLFLLENHGIIACGSSIEECIIISEICEKSAEIFIGAMLMGNIRFLSNVEINDLISDKKEKYRKNLL